MKEKSLPLRDLQCFGKKKIHSMFLLKIIELQAFNKVVVSNSNSMSPYKHAY